jgi:hypothetical protein
MKTRVKASNRLIDKLDRTPKPSLMEFLLDPDLASTVKLESDTLIDYLFDVRRTATS